MMRNSFVRWLLLLSVVGGGFEASAVVAAPGIGFADSGAAGTQHVRTVLDQFESEAPGTLGQVDPESALLAVKDVSIARIAVQARPGQIFQAPVDIDGAVMTLDLEPRSYRAPDFRVELVGRCEGGARAFQEWCQVIPLCLRVALFPTDHRPCNAPCIQF